MVSIRKSHLINAENLSIASWCELVGINLETTQMMLQVEEVYHNKLASDPKTMRELISYGIEMVGILQELNMTTVSIITAMLFPLIHNKNIDLAEVEEKFGTQIKKLLIGVLDMENIRQLNTSNSKNVNIDNIRRMLLAMVDDFRCVIIKLCDRVAFLRTAKDLPEEERVIAAKETANIYAPLANRLGIGQLKWELEDFSFLYLQPNEYKKIASLLHEKRSDREQFITNFVYELKQALQDEKIADVKVYGRPKHIYSIWRKMQKKNLDFSELFDVRAIRIIVNRLQDCYAALGVVHTRFKYIPKEFDDYITNPKPNGYQSIHTVVLGHDGKPVEIQIRTEQMHNDAELGIAAHWKYKEGPESGGRSGYEEKITWLRKLLAWQDEISDSGELLEEMRSQVFDDRVYVFTPNGEVIDLPVGATPLDFAYNIHSEIGHRCVGAKVNGKIIPFTYQLQMGEQVEIITQKNSTPSRDWLNQNLGYVKTSRARQKIFSWFKKQDKDKNIPIGKDILDHELQQFNFTNKQVEKYILPKFTLKNMEDLYAAIGSNYLRVGHIIGYLQNQLSKTKIEDSTNVKTQDKIVHINRTNKDSNKYNDLIYIEGVGNLMHYMAKCCNPIPSDNIAGYITQGHGISIHRDDCGQFINLKEQHEERVIDVNWNSGNANNFQAKLKIIANNKPSVLRDITAILANEKVLIQKISSNVERKHNLISINLELELKDVNKLYNILNRISQISDVMEAKRL